MPPFAWGWLPEGPPDFAVAGYKSCRGLGESKKDAAGTVMLKCRVDGDHEVWIDIALLDPQYISARQMKYDANK